MAEQIDIPRSLAEAESLLTPWPIGLIPFQIRSQQLALQGADAAVASALPIIADYYVGAILDLPQADVPVNGSMLSAWNVDIDVVVDRAQANRAQTEASVELAGAAIVVTGAPFAAAALRDPAVLGSLAQGRTPVIVVPEPGRLVLGFAEDAASLEMVAVVAEKVLAETAQSVSVTPLVSRGGHWHVFSWPEALEVPVARLERRWSNVQYAAAKPVVQASYQAKGRDVFVAEHALAENPEGQRITYAALSDMLSVVPRVDFLLLRADDGRMAQVPFAVVQARGDVLVPVDGAVPEYFVVNRFPAELL